MALFSLGEMAPKHKAQTGHKAKGDGGVCASRQGKVIEHEEVKKNPWIKQEVSIARQLTCGTYCPTMCRTQLPLIGQA
jgi:hypothetical protein